MSYLHQLVKKVLNENASEQFYFNIRPIDLTDLERENLQDCYAERLSWADLLPAVITIDDYPEISYVPPIATIFDKISPSFYQNLPSCQ